MAQLETQKCRMSLETARLATALLDIEPRLRKVRGYRHLSKLRDALK